ncbi:hypothetical protein MN0502_17310 [Arthrobacter sp. MN05-02]|nr:hypothetical protein MN0502_17310 [Arthrobacter sp. MN05-02]
MGGSVPRTAEFTGKGRKERQDALDAQYLLGEGEGVEAHGSAFRCALARAGPALTCHGEGRFVIRTTQEHGVGVRSSRSFPTASLEAAFNIGRETDGPANKKKYDRIVRCPRIVGVDYAGEGKFDRRERIPPSA